MTKVRFFFGLGIVFIIGVFWVQFSENRAIDRCLDAGNRWDHVSGTCDGS